MISRTGPRIRRFFASLVLGLTAIAPIAVPQTACAAGSSAALVIETGSATTTYCVDLGGKSSVSGIEFVKLAAEQHGVAYGLGYGGLVVCSLAGVGTVSNDCLLDQKPYFWGYWRGDGSGGWTWSSTGAGSARVVPGGVEGWSWGTGTTGDSHNKPPNTTYASVCSSGSSSGGGGTTSGGGTSGGGGSGGSGGSTSGSGSSGGSTGSSGGGSTGSTGGGSTSGGGSSSSGSSSSGGGSTSGDGTTSDTTSGSTTSAGTTSGSTTSGSTTSGGTTSGGSTTSSGGGSTSGGGGESGGGGSTQGGSSQGGGSSASSGGDAQERPRGTAENSTDPSYDEETWMSTGASGIVPADTPGQPSGVALASGQENSSGDTSSSGGTVGIVLAVLVIGGLVSAGVIVRRKHSTG